MSSEVFERIDHLMMSQRKKIKDLNNYLGLKQSTYDNWRRGKSESFMKHIDKIAEYLNVSPNYLICGSDSIETMKSRRQLMEDELLGMFRSISEKDANTLLNLATVFVSSLNSTPC
jgi:transcriptional regulator with XRE-family HTH domain